MADIVKGSAIVRYSVPLLKVSQSTWHHGVPGVFKNVDLSFAEIHPGG